MQWLHYACNGCIMGTTESKHSNGADEMSEGKAIEKAANKKGTPFALVAYHSGTWGVWKLCSNYCGQCRGGIRKTWRAVQKDMTEQDARDLYRRRLKGTQL